MTRDPRARGVSDPSLIWAVNNVQPTTPEQESTARRLVERSFPTDSIGDRTARAELNAILFDDPMEVELLAA